MHSFQSALEFDHSKFSNGGFALHDSAVYLGRTYVLNGQNSLSVSISACHFANLTAQLDLFQRKQERVVCRFIGNTARSCSAEYGEVLCVSRTSMLVAKSNFTGSQADFGGAVWTSGVLGSSEPVVTAFTANTATTARVLFSI